MLIATSAQLYDAKGKCLGYRIIEVPEGFTYEELMDRPDTCDECSGAGGTHRIYFHRTGQNPGGEVEGYSRPYEWLPCSRMKT